MNKKVKNILVALVVLFALVFVSCNVSRGEAATEAYLKDDILIAGVNGTDFADVVNISNVVNPLTLSIQLVNGEFQNVSNAKDVSEWIYPEEARISGIQYQVYNLTNSSLEIRVTGTPQLSGKERYASDITVKIPAFFISGRYNPVSLSGDKKAKMKIYASTDRVGFVSNTTSNNYTFNVGYNLDVKNFYQVKLFNTSATLKKYFDSSSWFDIPSFFKFEVQNIADNADSFPIDVEFTWDSNKDYSLVSPTNGIKKIEGTIPKDVLSDGDTNGDLTLISYAIYKIGAKGSYAYLSDDITIDGVTSLSDTDTIEEKQIVLNLSNGTFNSLTSEDVTSWFLKAPSGLKFTVNDYASLNGKTSAVITVSGTPKSPSSDKLVILIPNGAYSGYNGSSYSGPFYADIKNSYYNIKRGDYYSWTMYDLASFVVSSNKHSQFDSTNIEKNINKEMTKYADGSDLEFIDGDSILAYGDTASVILPKGLSRKGYILKGFGVKTLNKQEGPNVYDFNKYDFSVAYPVSDSSNISFTLRDEHKGEDISLFAIWEEDKNSIYWKEADSITITKKDIDEATVPSDDTYLNNLAHHDGSALEEGYEQTVSFIALPAGKLKDNSDGTSLYFKWRTSFERNDVDSGNLPNTYDVEIKNDFAVADIELTAALWNVVYAWATSDERGEKKYNFDKSLDKYILMAGVKNDITTAAFTSRHSAEDPLSSITWYQSVIFANALTEWYNEVKLGADRKSEWLTVAYTKDGTLEGEVLRDASDTVTLEKINSEVNNVNYADETRKGLKRVENATGFRLPTRAEWLYAASVVPFSDVKEGWSLFVGTNKLEMSFPYARYYGNISGGNIQVNITPPNGDGELRDYAVYKRLYEKSSDYGTQTVGKYFKADNVRVNGAKPNALGLYDMTGNTPEWNEDWYGYNLNIYGNRIASGRNWYDTPVNSLNIGNTGGAFPGRKDDETYAVYGVRFCRSLISDATN